jgi:hypothetical protein
MVNTGFQRDVQGRTRGARTGGSQGKHLCMRFPSALMKPLTDNLALLDHESADRRVG